jgi:hypothetical protein
MWQETPSEAVILNQGLTQRAADGWESAAFSSIYIACRSLHKYYFESILPLNRQLL